MEWPMDLLFFDVFDPLSLRDFEAPVEEGDLDDLDDFAPFAFVSNPGKDPDFLDGDDPDEEDFLSELLEFLLFRTLVREYVPPALPSLPGTPKVKQVTKKIRYALLILYTRRTIYI